MSIVHTIESEVRTIVRNLKYANSVSFGRVFSIPNAESTNIALLFDRKGSIQDNSDKRPIPIRARVFPVHSAARTFKRVNLLESNHLRPTNSTAIRKHSTRTEFIIESAEELPDPLEVWQKQCKTPEQRALFHKLFIKTIDSLISKRYSEFDAHTTTNCCHGMASFARDLIDSSIQTDLFAILRQALDNSETLEDVLDSSLAERKIEWIPSSLLHLTNMRTLSFVSKMDPDKGRRTEDKRLKLIHPVGTTFSNKLIRNLQRLYSNTIATRYQVLHRRNPHFRTFVGHPLDSWAKYVKVDYLRRDEKNCEYASSLFSTATVLADLIARRRIMVTVRDRVYFSSQNSTKREIQFFQGDGKTSFYSLSNEDVKILQIYHQNTPVVVFGGYVVDSLIPEENIPTLSEKWTDPIELLLMAHETQYPQFPKGSKMDSTPITPQEADLREFIDSGMKVRGVSIKDPTLFVPSHIFPASVKEVLDIHTGIDIQALPDSVSYSPSDMISKTSI